MGEEIFGAGPGKTSGKSFIRLKLADGDDGDSGSG